MFSSSEDKSQKEKETNSKKKSSTPKLNVSHRKISNKII